ncbi:MAG: DNA polymerase III subunit gamma/tau, partial [Actinomycetota bacterium]
GQDPRRFAQDLRERLRDLVIAYAVDAGLKRILRQYPDDLLERMLAQSARMGGANLSRAAAIVAEGLNQMRGATAPRLILELIVSRIVITGGDGSDQGAIARIERLERQLSMEPMPTKSAPSKPVKEAPKAAPVTTAAPVKEVKEKPAPSSSPKSSTPSVGNLDVTALRRMWPEVIESVKKKRRLTWSLLSASAQILSVDENHITIG